MPGQPAHAQIDLFQRQVDFGTSGHLRSTSYSICLMTPKEIAVHWFEQVWQQRSKKPIHELLTEDSVSHQPGGTSLKGPAAFDQYHDQILAAFPDQSLKILHAVGDDTQACLHWQVTGTHAGPLGPLGPSQKKVCFTGMTLITVKDGKVTEGWDCWDFGSLMKELFSKQEN